MVGVGIFTLGGNCELDPTSYKYLFYKYITVVSTILLYLFVLTSYFPTSRAFLV